MAEFGVVFTWGEVTDGYLVEHDALLGRPVRALVSGGDEALAVAGDGSVWWLSNEPVRARSSIGEDMWGGGAAECV